MDLQILWFVLIALLLGAATSCSRASTSASGCCCRSCRATSESAATMFETIGPVWDGNEVWLVVAGGATFAAFPAWYATMFSGFYLALLLVLVFLIVRVRLVRVAREEREPALARGLDVGERRRQRRRVADLGRRRSSNLLYGVPIDSNGDFTGHLLGPLQRLHGARRGRGRAPVRLPRRDASSRSARPATSASARPRAARRLVGRRRRSSARPSSSGRSPSRSTATTRTSSRRSCRPRSAIAALVLAVALRARDGGAAGRSR